MPAVDGIDWYGENQVILGDLALEATRTSDPVDEDLVPDVCKGPVDTPSPLPTLSYYCDIMPNICANIRSSPAWPGGNSMVLTYDPYEAGTGKRRAGVCTAKVKNAFQTAGKCDKRQHDPAYWKVCQRRSTSESDIARETQY